MGREPVAQRPVFRFELHEAESYGCERALQFGFGESGRNVLGAIPIEGLDAHQERAFDLRLISRQ